MREPRLTGHQAALRSFGPGGLLGVIYDLIIWLGVFNPDVTE